jgi:protein-disulfide isomerase
VAVAVVAIVAILIATGGSKSGPPPPSELPKISAEVTALVGGIPQSGTVVGNPKAPVTLQYFGDLECPICKDFTLGALPLIIEQWVRSGKLKIEYRSMETATREAEVFKSQQLAALAAGKQGKMWNYLELFYHEQGEENTGYVTESFLQRIAQQVPGLNLTKWTSDRSDPTLTSQLEADRQTVASQGFSGTPAFLLGKSGTTLQKLEPGTFTDATPYNAAIEKALKK